MNKATKTFLLNSTDKKDSRDMRYRYDREERGPRYNEREMSNAYRGGYDARYGAYDGRYEMTHPRDDDEPESRFRDRRGREHYDNGRYAPMRNEMDVEDRTRRMPTIGFDMREDPVRSQGDGGSYSKTEYGHGRSYERGEPMTKEEAKRWVDKMKNEDGSVGQHWTFEQVEQVLKQKMLHLDPVEAWVAMNMMWSDYYNVAKKFNVNNTDFYLEMAKAFLNDKDAGEEKLYKYFEYVVE